MARYARSIAGALVGVVIAAGVPGAGYAQQAVGSAVAEQMSPETAEAVQSLKAAIQEGNIDKVAQTLTGSVLKDPPVARLLAQVLGEGGAAKGPQFLAAVVERSSSSLSADTTGDRGLQMLVQFTSGVTTGVANVVGKNANLTRQMMQSVASSVIVGTSKTEAVLGQMARVVAAGMSQALDVSNSPLKGNDLIKAIQSGVSQGATKVAGPGVTVDVISEQGKLIGDIVVSKNGKEYDRGVSIAVITQLPPPPPNPDPKPSAS